MSEMEAHVGKVTKLNLSEEQVKNFMQDKVDQFKGNFMSENASLEEKFGEVVYEENSPFIHYKGNIYSIDNKELDYYGDTHAEFNKEKKELTYYSLFYNGSACINEVLQNLIEEYFDHENG